MSAKFYFANTRQNTNALGVTSRSQIPFGNAIVREVLLRKYTTEHKCPWGDFSFPNSISLLVPKFHLGTQLSAKFYFANTRQNTNALGVMKKEIEFQERARSQMEFGNESQTRRSLTKEPYKRAFSKALHVSFQTTQTNVSPFFSRPGKMQTL